MEFTDQDFGLPAVIKMDKIKISADFLGKNIEKLHKKFANFLNIMYNIYKRKRMERFTGTGELQSRVKEGFLYGKTYI